MPKQPTFQSLSYAQKLVTVVIRCGSVDLNRFRAFSRWISASVMPPPLRASAG
jgi:hypothetical protein